MALEAHKLAALRMAVQSAKVAGAKYPTWPAALGPVSVAQFCLESNWGASAPGNNPFGIKVTEKQAAAGVPYIEKPTWEDTNGSAPGGVVHLPQRFRKFATLAEAFEYHGRLLTEGKRDGALIYRAALAYPTDPHGFARALTGVYATDPDYGRKLVTLLDNYVLREWDTAG